MSKIKCFSVKHWMNIIGVRKKAQQKTQCCSHNIWIDISKDFRSMKLKHVHPTGLWSEICDYSTFEIYLLTFGIFVFQFKSDCLVIKQFCNI